MVLLDVSSNDFLQKNDFDHFDPILFKCLSCNAWFTFSSRVLVETFGEMWTRRSTHECRHSYFHAKIVNNEVRHSRFLWLRTDLPTCLWKLWDETRTGRECGRRDECTLHTLVLVLSRRECKPVIKFHFPILCTFCWIAARMFYQL